MVVNRIAIFFLLIFCAIELHAQNSYLDEMNLMNHQRNIQLVDTNKNIEYKTL
jgi:hypothetical protein